MSDDVISRQAAIDAFRKELCKEHVYATPFISFKGCERILNELPSAERRGRWINGNEGKWNAVIVPKCSICGETFYEMNVNINGEYTYNYCPNCGARMEEE